MAEPKGNAERKKQGSEGRQNHGEPSPREVGPEEEPSYGARACNGRLGKIRRQSNQANIGRVKSEIREKHDSKGGGSKDNDGGWVVKRKTTYTWKGNIVKTYLAGTKSGSKKRHCNQEGSNPFI